MAKNKLQEIIDNEETYQYKLVLNAKKPIEKMFMMKINESILTRNLSVKDAILDIFASQCGYIEKSNSESFENHHFDKNIDNVDKNVVNNDEIKNKSTLNTESSKNNDDEIDNKDISKDSLGIVNVDSDVTDEMKSVLSSMFGGK